jgi:L-2-hydroxyglutarate oxidase LhgO
VQGIAALHSPHTAVVDFGDVTRRLAADAAAQGAEIRTGVAVRRITQDAGGWPSRPAASGWPSTSW